MDGVFMRRLIKNLWLCVMIVVFFWCGTLVFDRQRLGTELIRFHVAANSDSPEDHLIRQKVWDTILESLEEEMKNATDKTLAEQYLRQKLPYIRSLAESTLRELGSGDRVRVELCREASHQRTEDFCILPAGVYQTLQIVIGEGAGESRGCVVYPQDRQRKAGTQSAEESESLPGVLAGGEGSEIRLIALDVLGRLQNLLFNV